MTGRTTRWTRALSAVAAATLAASAHAAAGNGIRFGGSDARLHPFVDLETRYDSNVTFTPANQAVGDLILHVRPGLELKAPSDQFAVEFSGALDWAQYLGIDGDTTGLSRMYANAALAAVLNRSGAFSPRLDNTFARQISTTSLAAASTAAVSNQNTLTLSLPWKPGGGALVLALNGQWLVESFEKYQGTPLVNPADLGYNQYRVGADAQWRFLPRTSGLLQLGYYTRVPNVTPRPDEATGYDVVTGVTGLVTQRVAATAKVGYGAISPQSGAPAVSRSVSAFITDLAAEWLPADTIALNAGYNRAVGLDPTVGGYVVNGVSGGGRLKLADRYAFRVSVRYDRFSFVSISGSSTGYLRVDPAVDAAFGRWLNAGLGYVYSMRSASWPAGAPPDYSKHEAFVKVGFTY